MDTIENTNKSIFNDQLRERTIQNAVNLYWLLKDRKVTWIITPGRESDDSEFIIRSCKFPGCNPCTLRYSEVEQPVRLFNAIKSKMKIKIGGKDCEI